MGTKAGTSRKLLRARATAGAPEWVYVMRLIAELQQAGEVEFLQAIAEGKP